MTVWAIFRVNGHRCLSVWTSEVAARQARQPGQYVIKAHLVPTIAAVTDQVTRPTVPRVDRAAVLDAACSRLTAEVTAYGMSARSRSRTPLGE